MKLKYTKLLFQIFIVKLISGYPINYEDAGKENVSIKSIKSHNLLVQQDVSHGREELTAYASQFSSSNSPHYNNKFNKIHRYQNTYHKNSKNEKAVKTSQDQLLPNNETPDREYIPDHYIVLFKKEIGDTTMSQHINMIRSMVKIKNNNNKTTNEIKHVYNMDGFRGYYGKFDKDTIKFIKESSEVLMIERDKKIRINNDLNVQINAPWNLSRISRRQFNENSINKEKYVYQHSSGQNITVYVVDTGINIHHVEFGGRATWGKTFSEEIEDEDLNGHGTHVAGIIGGTIYGVAKKVNLVAVKVINKNGEGSLSNIIQGIEFSINDHIRRIQSNTSKYPVRSVINISLGGPLSNILNRAANMAVRYNINVVTAAGNEYENACHSSPASSPNVITVAATNSKDEMTNYSNYGNCVNVFAPGDRIESAWTGSSNNLINMSSGTSMACPHVAGVVALLLDTERYANYKPNQVLKLVENLSTKNVVRKIPIWSNTPNRLIYSSPPVKGTEFADNDKTNENEPDNLNDIIDDDDDDDNKNKGDDGVGDIIDDDDDKPDDLDDVVDDDDKDKADDGVGDIIDDDDDKPDDLDDVVDDDDKDKADDGVGDIIDDDDNNKNKGDDGVGDIIDDDDDKPDNLDDVVDDDDNKDKADDGVGDIIDDDDDDDKPDNLDDVVDDDNNNNKNESGDLDKIEDENNYENSNTSDFDGVENSEYNNNKYINDLNDAIDNINYYPDNFNDIIGDIYTKFKNIFINKSRNNVDNTIKLKKPRRKDKTYISYYHYEQIKKEYNLKDY
ncbi:subtilisin-like protein [Piromyces finnis]|uniref:Subtilisin-like protein n=1 Tax=Piromyces finnis TaxID=1754191 RepID=A0A1Y1V1R1_9FUNG|nr:subtilisin-like protein [Piromyces finnis]|eukprot:ORX45200.1 subtilisin-like protein [Piromyces finnis]